MPPPRVLFVSSHAQRGGAESYLERLLRRLGPAVIPRVAALEDGPLVTLLREQGFAVSVVPAGRRAGLATAAVPLRRAIARERVDVVHANGVKAALVCALALAGRRERLLWVKHDHSWDGRLTRAVARRCDLVVGVSRSVLHGVGPAATRVVPPGVEVEPVQPTVAHRVLRDAAGAAADDVMLVVVGRLDPAKGFDTAIDVLARVRDGVPDARLAVVGGDDPRHPGERDRLLARARSLGVADSVRLLGHRQDAQLLLAGADVVLVTSRAVDGRGMGREGFGLVAAEALAHGVPVAGYADGAIPEVVGDAGLLVAPGNVAALADAVRRLLLDPQLRVQLATAARNRPGAHDLQTWAEAMRRVYVELAGRSGRRASRRHAPGSGRTS